MTSVPIPEPLRRIPVTATTTSSSARLVSPVQASIVPLPPLGVGEGFVGPTCAERERESQEGERVGEG